MATAEVIAVGNEILLGLVQDTNTSYLCRVVRGMGGHVNHAAVVRDEAPAIASEIQASLSRSADIVFTCGGLGPTVDDLTLAAVAQAVGRIMVLNTEAREFVERRYRELAEAGFVANADMEESRLKMAIIPDGSTAIENSVGAAPAVVTQFGRTKIVSLPGVPAELKGIVKESLQPLLNSIFGSGVYREREILVDCGDESVLAPLLRKVIGNHPEVYIKSRANHFGPDVKFRLLFSATGESSARVEQRVEDAVAEVISVLERAGIHLSRETD